MKAVHLLMGGVACVAVAALAFSQPSERSPRPDDLAGQIEALRGSLDDVSATLELAVAQQRANLLLKRIELAHLRMRPDESRLNRLQNDRRSARESLEQLQVFKSQVIQEAELAGSSGDPADSEAQRRLLSELDDRIEESQEQLSDAEEQIQQAELDMQSRQKAIDDLDSQLLDLIENLDRR